VEWRIELKESVTDDLRWFGRRVGRAILADASARLTRNPLGESKSIKTLRPNRFAQRELRLSGKYRVLFNVNETESLVTILLVGEKQGNKLIVQGEEFHDHESDSVE
jgi:mRNA-degrading endonuclease RelE of RelBE toxin-antitoxin system